MVQMFLLLLICSSCGVSNKERNLSVDNGVNNGVEIGVFCVNGFVVLIVKFMGVCNGAGVCGNKERRLLFMVYLHMDVFMANEVEMYMLNTMVFFLYLVFLLIYENERLHYFD